MKRLLSSALSLATLSLRTLSLLTLLCCAVVLSACAGVHDHNPEPVALVKPAAPALAADGTALTYVDGVPVEKVAFRAGVSSATVEQLARAQACAGGLGAGLVSATGPIEIYRMACDNGKTFVARCDLRQCRAM